VDRKLTGMLVSVAVVALLVFSVPLTGCLEDDEDAITITIAGSTTVQPVITQIAEAYMEANDAVDVQVSGGGSGQGVSQAGSGQVDIGMASRDVKASEMEEYPDLVVYDIAKDGIALIVNNANEGMDALSVEEIRGVYNGTYTNWNELGGDAGEIVVVGRDSNSGTRDFFWDFVMEKEDFVAGMLEEASNGAVRGTVQTTPGAIGFVGLGYIDDSIKALDIDVDGTLVTPTVANVLAGDYPISRTLHLLTDGQPTGLALEFIEFILSPEGQSLVADEGFVPLE
jgi:phosphate transport system substrate-binding protein